MDPFTSGQLRIDPDETMIGPAPRLNGSGVHRAVADPIAARRADIDSKQRQLAALLEAIGCEAALLFVPSHVAWFTAGMNVRGLIADSERPGVYTNGQQRWLLCSGVDTHRLFDEELDRLGFQLKEWTWEGGRADLVMNVAAGRKVAFDRPFPNVPLVNERLRPLLRVLSAFEREAYEDLGRLVAHAVEATARHLGRGQTEAEAAGQIGHRLLHHGAEPAVVSVTADGRGAKFRRAGFTAAPVERTCVLQATAHRDGLYATASRAVSLGPPPPEFRTEYDLAVRLAAVYRSFSRPDETTASAAAAGQMVLTDPAYEYDWRLTPPGYGAGRFPAEELRRAGQDEPFADGQPLVWQPRVGAAAVVDTVIVTPDGADTVTPVEDWPFKRVTVRGQAFDIPDILVRTD
jgi:Xaa-Pro dipeptidase